MAFVQSIMKEYEDVPDYKNNKGMKVLKDVVVLEEGNTIIEYIVLRKNLEDFWNQVIATVEPKSNNDHIPVCAVSTPGIGKSLTTPILIRLLLKQKKKLSTV